MAQTLSKEQVKQILLNAPEGTTPTGILSGLRAKGYQLEGYPTQPTIKKEGTTGLLGVGTGILKGAGSTAVGAGQLLEKFLPGEFIATEEQFETAREKLRPKTTAEKIGFTAEQIGEFFIPAGIAAKGIKAGEAALKVTKLGKAALKAEKAVKAGKELSAVQKLERLGAGVSKLGIRAGVTGAEAGAVTAIQTGGDIRETVRNTLIGGAVPIGLTALRAGIKGVARPLAEKIETALIKPTQSDIKDGFKVANVFKHNVGGSLQDSAEKTHTKITELSNQLKGLISASKTRVDIGKLIDDVEKEITKKKATTFGVNTRINKAVNFLREELSVIKKSGKVSLSDAQQIKRSVGKLGAWQFGVRDPDASALEKVSNQLYTKLRLTIEKVSPKELAGINKQLGELIPIENALIRRIPIAERANVVGLTDILTTLPAFSNPANLWLFVLNRLAKSGTVAKGLFSLGKEPIKRGAIGTTLFGGLNKGQTPLKEEGAKLFQSFLEKPKK